MIKLAYFRGLMKVAGSGTPVANATASVPANEPAGPAGTQLLPLPQMYNAQPRFNAQSQPESIALSSALSAVPRRELVAGLLRSLTGGLLPEVYAAQRLRKLIRGLARPPKGTSPQPSPRPLSLPTLETQQPVPPTHPAVSPARLRPRLPTPAAAPAPYNKKA